MSTLSTTGTFLFPPVDYGPDGIASYLRFWEETPASDRVLSNLISVYRVNRETWIGEQLDAWAVVFGNDRDNVHRWSKNAVTREDIASEHEAARAIELARLKAERPIEHIYGGHARGIAVAAQMYNSCASFTPEEQERVDSHEIVVARGVPAATVKAIYQKYHLEDIVGIAFVDQDLGVRQELEQLRRHLGAFNVL